MSKSTIRVGVVGAGANTRKFHIPNLQAQAGVEVVSVANRTKASGQKVAKEFGIANVSDDWTEVVNDPDLDAICIGTWPYMHAPITIAALEAGKHVLCEARMALDSDEGQSMLDCSRDHPKQIAQIVPAPHTLALDQTICELIGEGYVGEIIQVDARINAGAGFPQWDTPVHWRHDRELSGNNVMNMGIWYEAMMRWMGPASSVNAVGQNIVRHRKDSKGNRVTMTIPDHVDVTGRLEQGGQYRMNVSSVVGHADPADVMIFGTEGTLRIGAGTVGGSGLGLYGGKRRNKSLAAIRIPAKKIGSWRVEEEFVNAIRGKEQITHTDLATGVRYMHWTDAVTRSLRTAETVPLPLNI
ncbi:MAG: putative dehydrogenase [Gammaproteobacteria bacterium]|jgi:predicted dehydrogenase